MHQTEIKGKIILTQRLRDQTKKSKNGIMVSDKSQAEYRQDWTNYLLIISFLQIE